MRALICMMLLICAMTRTSMAQIDTIVVGFPTKTEEFPFSAHLKTDILLSGTAGLCWGATLFTSPNALDITELNALDRHDLWTVDRYPTYVDSANAVVWKLISDYSNYATFAAPAVIGLTLILIPAKTETATYAMMYTEGILLTFGLTQVLKEAVSRPRPYTYQDNYSVDYRLEKDEWASFPSAHTSSAAFNCFFAAACIDKLWINNEEAKAARIITWSAAALLPAFTGFSRIQAGRHFPTDVAAGYALGAGLGLLIPYLHSNTNTAISMQPIFAPNIMGARVTMALN